MKTKNKKNLTDKEIIRLLRERSDVLRKYKVRKIGLFGSYVRGEQKIRSDVDILVEFNEEDIPGLYKFIEFEHYIEKIIRKKVDLVRRGAIRSELKDIILDEVIYI